MVEDRLRKRLLVCPTLLIICPLLTYILDVVRNIGELIEQHLAAQTPAGEDAEFVAYPLNNLANLRFTGTFLHLPMVK